MLLNKLSLKFDKILPNLTSTRTWEPCRRASEIEQTQSEAVMNAERAQRRAEARLAEKEIAELAKVEEEYSAIEAQLKQVPTLVVYVGLQIILMGNVCIFYSFPPLHAGEGGEGTAGKGRCEPATEARRNYLVRRRDEGGVRPDGERAGRGAGGGRGVGEAGERADGGAQPADL